MLKNIAESITATDVRQFREQGFWIRSESIFENDTSESLKTLRLQLEEVLKGKYDLNKPPAKMNKAFIALSMHRNFTFDSASLTVPRKEVVSTSPARQNTIHLVNIWQSNHLFNTFVTSPVLGAAVVKLMGWENYGCRIAQDQVWIKPPFSGPLSYHRDTPYIDFVPKEVCTVWMPLSTVTQDCGTLEYCAGSHLWSSTKRGSTNQFYNRHYKALLVTASQETGETADLDSSIYFVLPELGGCSFHNGNVWHGSNCNNSQGWRCGIGIHFVRGDASLMKDMGSLWQQLQGPSGSCAPNPESFPKVV